MNQEVTFTASTVHINHLGDVFRAACTINSQGLLIINDTGITVYCNDNHILNCQSIIDISLFNNYSVTSNSQSSLFVSETENRELTTQELTENRKDIRFSVDLELINHAFETVNAKDAICYLSYQGEGSAFVVEFEDNLISETVEFLTFYSDIVYPYDEEDQDQELIVNYSDLEFEVILKSDLFSNLLRDLTNISTKELYLYLSTFPANELSFISQGPVGLSKLIYPNEKTILEKLELFDNTEKRSISTFKFANFIKVFKAVKLSSKCKIVKDVNGIFSIQLICKDGNNQSYSGTLITINMMELSEKPDAGNLENLFADNDITTLKKRKLDDSRAIVSFPASTNEYDVPIFL